MTTKVNIYRSGNTWYGARWINGEYDGCDELEAETETEAIAEAATIGDVVRRVDDIACEFVVGGRVTAGHGDDRDSGTIDAIRGDQVTVRWDSGTVTTQAASVFK